MLSKGLRIFLEWFCYRKWHIHYTNLLHSGNDSMKKVSQEALSYNKKESFFPRTLSTPRRALAPSLELVRGKIDSFLLYNRVSCDPFFILSLPECRRFV